MADRHFSYIYILYIQYTVYSHSLSHQPTKVRGMETKERGEIESRERDGDQGEGKESAAKNLTWKTYIFTNPKSCLFFYLKNYFYFLFLLGTPMNNCAKYQHPKHKCSIFLKNQKIAFFTFFKGLKNWPFEEKNVWNFFAMLYCRT